MGGAGPIPWAAIHTWARYRGLTRDEEEELSAWLWAIDAEMLKGEERAPGGGADGAGVN